MKRFAALLVLGSSILMTAVDAQACSDRQKREPNGSCSNCPDHTRAQPWQGQNNAYCQGDICADSSDTQKRYINSQDGTCFLCQGGTTPSQPDPTNGLRTQCVTGSGASTTCNGCLQYRDTSGNCVTCRNDQVLNFNRNGCTFRPNCLTNQYYDSCNQCQSCSAGTTYNPTTGSCTQNTSTVTTSCNCDSEFNSAAGTCVRCNDGMTSDNAQRTCQYKAQTCNANNQVQLGQSQCYQCQTCTGGASYNPTTRQCSVAAPVTSRAQCQCYEEYNAITGRCDGCQTGYLSNNVPNGYQAGTCQIFNAGCAAQGRGTDTQNNCYRCIACASGTSFNTATNRCETVQAVSQCNCDQRYDSGSNTCVTCPPGQMTGNAPGGYQAGQCNPHQANCAARGQQTLSQAQCYACAACPAGQTFSAGRCQAPRPSCNCDQEYNTATNNCDTCQPGQLSQNSFNGRQDLRCTAYNSGCSTRGQLQLSQNQCYACQSCPSGQSYVNGSCQAPRPSCNCDQEYNSISNTCDTCATGSLSQNSYNGRQDLRCQVYNSQCSSRGQLQLSQQQCYQCQSCPSGQQLVGGSCQLPRPTCQCYQEYNSVTNRCDTCPTGQLSNNGVGGRQDLRCQVYNAACNVSGQQQLSQTQCFRCQACPTGQQLVGNTCQVPRPTCQCYEEYNSVTNRCDRCRAGTLSGNGGFNGRQDGRCTTFASTCNQNGQIQQSQDQCYACASCSGLNQIVVGNACVNRVSCSCWQQYNQATNTCSACPSGQLADAQTGRCTQFTLGCNNQGLRQLTQQQCYQCQACPAGQQLNSQNTCITRPTCQCYEEYNSVTNRCDRCRAGTLSNNGGFNGRQDGRCTTFASTCNQNGQIQQNQESCYACASCNGINQVIVGNACVNRVSCSCWQQYNQATNTCSACPSGQLADAQTGRCTQFTLGCNNQGLRQLTQQQCYQCQACPAGQQLNNQNTCITPRPNCPCYQFVNSQNLCETCPQGQLADQGRTRCLPQANTCTTLNQIRGDQYNCYACSTCSTFEIPNTSRTACIARPFVNCGCLSRRDSTGYQCINCPLGQIQDPNNANQCIGQQVCDQFSYRLARDATSCGRCQRCNWPSQIPDPVTQSRCVARPRPSCNCVQRYGDGGYSCIECPYGQIRNPNKNDECMNPATCSGTNQIQLAVDLTTCGRCQTCQYPAFIPDISRTNCVQRPFAVCTDCTTRQSNDGYSCENCPVGQVVSPQSPKTCYTPSCTGNQQIRLTINNISCGACETCQWPIYMANTSRTQCILRPRAECPSCTQRQSDDGYSCVACPAGQVSDSINPQLCYTPTCNGPYDIQLRVDNRSCGKCQACAFPRQIPNNERTACINRPFAQCQDCLTRRSDDNYSCEQCPYGQVQDVTNMNRCVARTCNSANQIQLGVDSVNCGRCETCQWPQFMPDTTKTQCIARPLAVCTCREKVSADGYSCDACPTGYVQSLSNNKQCVRPNCGGQYEIQLSIDLNNCGRCETCQWPQFAPNSSKTQCVPRPLANCNCLSRRDNLGYSCERCGQGQIQDPNNVNQCITPFCGGSYQITKPVDAQSCGRCEECQFPRYIPNNQRTQCILRPFAQCDCLSRHSTDRYSCEECPYGQYQDPRNSQRCIDAPRCNVGSQIVGLRDPTSCYRCRTCTLPQIPRDDRSECYRPRPQCGCTQKYSDDGYSCLQCPNGQVSDDARLQCYPAPQCYGLREILGTRGNCYRCTQCQGNLVPNDLRNACVRPIPVCQCYEKYSADGYECQACPVRQVVDPNNNKRCIPQQCNDRNMIFGNRDYCYQCEMCQPGWEPNPARTECLRIKPKCSCTEIYDASGYVCIPCPPFEVATNGNQRCVPRQCSGLNDVLGTADQCYACRPCEKGSTPDNLRRRCLRYITTSCTCQQRFDDSGFGCITCPQGTRPSLDNRSCVSLNCERDQILRNDLLCPQCEWCPPGSIPDPKRESCIVKPRPAINVNGVPTCDEFSVFNMDRTECIKCPSNLKASEDNLRCLNSCTDPLDIVQEDGSCFTCCNGNVPNYSKTRCVKKSTATQQCVGDREIYNSDRTRCTTCDPYTRAQRQNSVCLSDQCGANQIVTWLGTCAECLAGERKVDQYTCSGSPGTRLNSQLVEEPVEEVSSAAKKEKSFPTAAVAGLGIVIMILSAVTGMICMRRNEKTNSNAVQEEQPAQSPVNEDSSMEKAPTDDSGSNGKNSE